MGPFSFTNHVVKYITAKLNVNAHEYCKEALESQFSEKQLQTNSSSLRIQWVHNEMISNNRYKHLNQCIKKIKELTLGTIAVHHKEHWQLANQHLFVPRKKDEVTTVLFLVMWNKCTKPLQWEVILNLHLWYEYIILQYLSL